MNQKKLLTAFTTFALLAALSMTLLFQNSTINASALEESINVPYYAPQFHERQLAREPCKYVDAILGVSSQDCQMLARLACEKANKVQTKFRGDPYVPSMNCLTQCTRDARAQCDYAYSSFNREGKR